LIIVGSPIFLTASANPEDAFWKSFADTLFDFCDDRSPKSDALDDAWIMLVVRPGRGGGK
jgi:hypothetical protein